MTLRFLFVTPTFRSGAPGAFAASRAIALFLATAASHVVVAASIPARAEATVSFNQHVQPILSENCYHCHGPDATSRKAGLRLDRAEFALAARDEHGPAIVAGKPEASPLVQRIESTDEKRIMPPPEAHKTLKPEELATLRRWVAQGAVYEEHWAFVAPKRPRLPAVADKKVSHPVDRFIGARLAGEKLALSPEADRRTLLRRVSLDLTGILPTESEIAAFLADRKPGAYERVVDRLLASPRYGEHRARYWLDYVRYADTHGHHLDNFRSIWPYRDYVIGAFNENRSFDQFVLDQLAGDLLPARSVDQLAATGFVRSNLTTNEGGTVPEEVFVNQTRDRVESFGATFLGLTTGCAACHDHKFDPISQRDFYGLAAYLNNTAERAWDFNIADPEPVMRLAPPETRKLAEEVFVQRADWQAKLEARRAQGEVLLKAWLDGGQRPQRVSDEKLEVRLRMDEGKGNELRNSAPEAKAASFSVDGTPLEWGEENWFWPSARTDIASRIFLGEVGDIDTGDAITVGGWFLIRVKPGSSGTGDGPLISRRAARDGQNRGWEIYAQGERFGVALISEQGKHELRALTRKTFPRGDWVHVMLTYTGTPRGGVKLYVNGVAADLDFVSATLDASSSIRTTAATAICGYADGDLLREMRFQDLRIYRRALSAAEIGRVAFEDIAAEIVAREPNPAKWSRDETWVVRERFFLEQIDAETRKIASTVAAHDAAYQALTANGTPTLIAREKRTPAYADMLKRGDYFAREEKVGPSTPHFLPPLPDGQPENRLGLAHWLLAPENPLFARVTVNRMWQELFGRGLV
ncbi:MAG: DUF1549 domain-containing protein, partial [Rariglobus sp.]